MVSIDISELESDDKDGLEEFVQSKLPVKSERDGDVLTIEDKSERSHVSSPEIKTYLKRYIHSKNLRKKIRLLSNEGTLKFVKKPESEQEEDEEEK